MTCAAAAAAATAAAAAAASSAAVHPVRSGRLIGELRSGGVSASTDPKQLSSQRLTRAAAASVAAATAATTAAPCSLHGTSDGWGALPYA
jgi:outer membrane protein W